MWMFGSKEDLDCDVKMLLELRVELTDDAKYLDRIMVAQSQRCSEQFNALCNQLVEPIQSVKASCAGMCHRLSFCILLLILLSVL